MNSHPDMFNPRLSWRAVLISVTVALAVALVAVYVRLIELRREQDQFLFQANNVSAVLSARLADHVASRLDAAKIFRPALAENGFLDLARFRTDAMRMHELFRDIQALNYVDADGIIRVVTPPEGNQPALGLDLTTLSLPARAMAEARRTGELQITPPIILAQGGIGFTGYLPIREGEEFLGFFNIVFRAEALIGPLLTDHIRRTFEIRVLDGDNLLFDSSDGGPRVGEAVVTMVAVANRDWAIEIGHRADKGLSLDAFFRGAIVPFGLFGAMIVGMLSFLAVSRQASLEDSQSRLTDFAGASSDWFWETDRHNRLVWLSDGFTRALGARKEQFLGRDRRDLALAAERDGAAEGQALDLAGHKPFRDFTYPVLIEGQRKWVRTSGIPVFDRQGAFTGYRGTASNVTAEVEATAEAERAQWLLQTAVENLDEHFSVWDAEDRLVVANTRFRALNADLLAGLPANTTFEAFLRGLVASGKVVAATGCEEAWIAQRMARHRQPHGEMVQVFADGTVFRLKELRLENGGTVITGVDVTAQKKGEAALRASEERYELAARQVAIWDWDLRSDKLYVSPQFATRLGYSAEEFGTIAARSVAELIHPDDVGSYRAALAGHLNPPGSAFSHEHRFRTKSGDYRWYLARGQAIADASGRVTRSTGILTDITERVALEDRLRQSQKMEAVGQLTGGLAHDFNNLLAVVQGHAEALAATEGPAARRAEAILRAARRGSDLTQRLLAFSRRQPLRPEAIDCGKLARGLLELLQRTLGDRVCITLDLPDDLWPAMADPAQVETALLNLVINARDAMPEGGEVRISGHNEVVEADSDGLRPGRYVLLSVADAGHGMPEEVQRHAFEPFFTTKDVGKGTGLGLSMVYGFAQQSGGTATIDSTPGQGTTVTLFLPRALGGPSRSVADDTAPQGAGQTILVVEDDAEIRSLLSEFLEGLGYRAVTAAEAEEARARLADTPGIDLVLSDVVLPGGTGGAAFAAEVASAHPGLRLILMSGYPAETAPDGITWDLGLPLLVKPFGRSQLARALHEVLAGDGNAGPA